MMIKAFWIRFSKYAAYGILLAVFFYIGLLVGNYTHPYEQCARMYNSSDHIGECVWILKNK